MVWFFLLVGFFIPNLAFLVPGLGGTALVYVSWVLLFFAVWRRLGGGVGALSSWDVFGFGLVAVAFFSAMGFVWGFAVVPSLLRPDFFLTSAAMWGAELLGIEALRFLVLKSGGPYLLRTAVSVAVGMFYGNTIYTVAKLVSPLLDPGGWGRFMLWALPQVFYGLFLAMLYTWGGFRQGLIFAALVSGYWHLAPIRLTSELGYVGVVLQLVLYYTLYVWASSRFPTLRGARLEYFGSKARRLWLYAMYGLVLAFSAAVMYLAFSGYVPVAVVSGSMRPTIDVGDLVIIKRTADVSVGDVVAYWAEGVLILHRVVEVDPSGRLVTKGDALPLPDPWLVPREAVVGKAVYRIPLLGYPVMYMRTSGFNLWPIVVGALLGIIVINEWLKRRREFPYR